MARKPKSKFPGTEGTRLNVAVQLATGVLSGALGDQQWSVQVASLLERYDLKVPTDRRRGSQFPFTRNQSALEVEVTSGVVGVNFREYVSNGEIAIKVRGDHTRMRTLAVTEDVASLFQKIDELMSEEEAGDAHLCAARSAESRALEQLVRHVEQVKPPSLPLVIGSIDHKWGPQLSTLTVQLLKTSAEAFAREGVRVAAQTLDDGTYVITAILVYPKNTDFDLAELLSTLK